MTKLIRDTNTGHYYSDDGALCVKRICGFWDVVERATNKRIATFHTLTEARRYINRPEGDV